MVFLRLFVIFITFSLISLIGILCMYVDMKIFGLTYITEESVTEIMQELMVFIVCILYACSIKNTKEFLRINILVFGFFTAILIREFDFVFDKISHGSWVWAAVLASIMAIALAFKEPKRLARELDEYMQTKAFLLMLFGLCLVLVFGRVFGTGSFWAVILPSSEISVVKNIVQEGIEFLGYTMCLISAIVFNTKNLNFKGKK